MTRTRVPKLPAVPESPATPEFPAVHPSVVEYLQEREVALVAGVQEAEEQTQRWVQEHASRQAVLAHIREELAGAHGSE